MSREEYEGPEPGDRFRLESHDYSIFSQGGTVLMVAFVALIIWLFP